MGSQPTILVQPREPTAATPVVVASRGGPPVPVAGRGPPSREWPARVT